jgi:hypothetical protein
MIISITMIERLNNYESLITNPPAYIWVVGLFAAGKTTIRDQLEADLGSVEVVTDGMFLTDVINMDVGRSWYKNSEGVAIITDTEFYRQMTQIMLRKLVDLGPRTFLIEKATGLGCNGAEICLNDLMQMMPDEVFDRSYFYYVHAPYSVRAERNIRRNGTNFNLDRVHTPDEPFERSMWGDDFEVWSKTVRRPLVVIDNGQIVTK